MNRGLFILLGECFRQGRENSRVRDTEYGYVKQKESTESHLKLIEKLETLNYKIDICINTYDTKYKSDLLKWYNDATIYYDFVNENYGCIERCVDATIVKVLNNVDIDPYDFIFICRLDILLKDPLIELFNPKVEYITYPNIMSWEKFPCISDLFCIIPKKYFHPFNNWKGLINNGLHILNHSSMYYLNINGLSYNDVDFMFKNIYFSNTSQMSNPYYKINCRDEGPDICFFPIYENIVYVKEELKLKSILN